MAYTTGAASRTSTIQGDIPAPGGIFHTIVFAYAGALAPGYLMNSQATPLNAFWPEPHFFVGSGQNTNDLRTIIGS